MRTSRVFVSVRYFYTFFQKRGDNLAADGSLIFDTKIDTSGFNKDSKNLASKVSGLISKVDGLNTGEGKNTRETRENAKEHDHLQSELSESKKSLSDVERKFDDVGDSADGSGGKLEKFSRVGSKIGGVVKGIGIAAAAAGAGIVAIGKKALDSYSEYEQLVGGVETLFKDLSNDVIENSNAA